LSSVDSPTYYKQLDAGKFQIARSAWNADYPIMDNFIHPLFDSKSTDNKSSTPTTGGSGNRAARDNRQGKPVWQIQ